MAGVIEIGQKAKENKMDMIINSVDFSKEFESVHMTLNLTWAVDRSRSNIPTYSNRTDIHWSNLFVLGNETDSDLFQMIQDLIERTGEGVGPLEMKGIEILSKNMLKELQGRLNKSEEQKTKRNKLIRYLRTELERLK